MNDLLVNIVKKQKLEIEKFKEKELIERFAISTLTKNLDSQLIKVILGPRRSGKSTLAMSALVSKQFAYFNFEEDDLPKNTNSNDLVDALKHVYGEIDYYFFDEIHLLPRWEQFLNKLHRNNQNIIVTGSNSNLLSDEFATSLTGRHLCIEIFPFCYKEIFNSASGEYDIKKYLEYGGFPDVATGKVDYRIYLSTLWDSIILKDIVRKNNIRNVQGLNDTLDLCLAGLCSRFNVDSLSRQLNGDVSSPTIKKFIKYAEEAYLISELQAYNFKPRVRIKSDRKLYTVDNGFYNARTVMSSPNLGILLENAVFNELRIRGYKTNHSLFYYITKSGFEIDFLIRKGHTNIEAIQVAPTLSMLKTREREFRALYEISKELNVNKLTVITLGEEQVETYKDIKIEIVAAKTWFSK